LAANLQEQHRKRQVDLNSFNKVAEKMSNQTKTTESTLKEKENKRYEVQVQKEGMEKMLVDLNEMTLNE